MHRTVVASRHTPFRGAVAMALASVAICVRSAGITAVISWCGDQLVLKALVIVAQLLAHASSTITQVTYQHLMPGMSEDAGERLSESLPG